MVINSALLLMLFKYNRMAILRPSLEQTKTKTKSNQKTKIK